MKVEVAVLGPVPNKSTVSVDVKQHFIITRLNCRVLVTYEHIATDDVCDSGHALEADTSGSLQQISEPITKQKTLLRFFNPVLFCYSHLFISVSFSLFCCPDIMIGRKTKSYLLKSFLVYE